MGPERGEPTPNLRLSRPGFRKNTSCPVAKLSSTAFFVFFAAPARTWFVAADFSAIFGLTGGKWKQIVFVQGI
jgi:hypothetical protein